MISDQKLPTEFPIFPLSGAVLFPHTRLPLNIFEPRYLSLIDAVLAGPRYLGMVQPRQTATETVDDTDALYGVGCLGRLTAFGEAEDGRYVITLTGIQRFRIDQELAMKDGYRRVQASFSPFINPQMPADTQAFDRAAFMKTLGAYLEMLGAEDSQQSFDKADGLALITAVAMSAPFSADEKQAVLECPDLGTQAELVRSIMEMATYGGDAESPALKH